MTPPQVFAGSEEVRPLPIRLPAPSRLLSDIEYNRMRASLTELAGLGIALQASVSSDELRLMVAESVRRALGAP